MKFEPLADNTQVEGSVSQISIYIWTSFYFVVKNGKLVVILNFFNFS